jgi:outer membrane protein assembly complex protein YaeT
MGRKLGVSQVSVQPGVIAAESDPVTRLTITEDFSRTVRLIYSMNLSDSSDQIWIMEYDLSRRLRSRFVKESDNSYRAEVRHEVRFGQTDSPIASLSKLKRRVGEIRFEGGDPFAEDELARTFRLKTGQVYSPIQVRAGTERLLRLLRRNAYIESRVVVDRDENDATVSLAVTTVPGDPVLIRFLGDRVPGSLKKRIHNAWQSGHNDRQRIEAARQMVIGHYGREGYLDAAVECDIRTADKRKEVTFDVRPGKHYANVLLAITGASLDHEAGIRTLIRRAKLGEAVYAEPRRVSEAITRYYRRLGYLAADVATPHPVTDQEAATAKVVIAVSEGPRFQVGDLHFKGNQALSDEALLSKFPLKPSGPFEPARLSAAITDLRTKYDAHGYRDALIEYELKLDAAKGLLNVTFSVQEKDQRVIDSVSVSGNRQTSETFVRRQLQVSPGEPESISDLNESIQRLSRTGAFSSVDIQSLPSDFGAYPNKTATKLRVLVHEPKPFRLLYGPLYNTNSGMGFIADFENRNSLGSARVLGLRTRYDGDLQEIRLYLTQPVWRRRLLTSTVTTYGKRENIAQGIRKNTIGASAQQDWPFHAKYLLSYGYRYEKLGLTRLVPDDIRSLPLGKVVIAPAFVTASRDTRDSFLDATRGSFAALGSEFAPAWLGSDYGYARLSGQYFRYFPLTKPRPVPYGETPLRSRLVFATGIRIGLQKGLTDEEVVLADRFFAGGGTTIRGFPQDSVGPQTPAGKPVGGNAMVVLNNELRFPLAWVFDGVVFNDIGNVYRKTSDFNLSDLRKSAGFGLRLRNPFVVLRFDYGIKLDRRPGESFGAFFFSIGQAF